MQSLTPIHARAREETGVFAPGHLGELTQYLPYELVDDVLVQTRTLQRRLRTLPSRAGVYFVLALALFPQLGYARVWTKLCNGLTGAVAAVRPSEKALRDLRRRLGPAPLRVLFEIVAGPVGQPRTPGVCFAGLRTVAFDGLNSLKVPDSDRNRRWLGHWRYHIGWAGYPNLRLMCLVETGTRALLGATIGGDITEPGARDETSLARRLLPLLGPGMLVLLDRGFDKNAFFTEIDHTGAALLARARHHRIPPVLTQLSDGSYLSDIGGLAVRVIEAEIAVRSDDGAYAHDRYRLITTLLDHRRYPAEALIRLYHERWEIESAFYALRHTLLGQVVLRSHDRPGLEQETWALLTVYQLLRRAMTDAIETRPGLDPDRASFTTALQTARDQVITAAGIHPASTGDGPTDWLGAIGRAVLATLLPPRRPRYSSRTVKCPTSRYHDRGNRGGDTRPTHTTTITAIDITVVAPPPGQQTRYAIRRAREQAAVRRRGPSRLDQTTALMATDPTHPWTARELADQLHTTHHIIRTQLGQWTRQGVITRIATGRYTLNTPTPPTTSTQRRDH